jgi:hypothetical protein
VDSVWLYAAVMPDIVVNGNADGMLMLNRIQPQVRFELSLLFHKQIICSRDSYTFSRILGCCSCSTSVWTGKLEVGMDGVS